MPLRLTTFAQCKEWSLQQGAEFGTLFDQIFEDKLGDTQESDVKGGTEDERDKAAIRTVGRLLFIEYGNQMITATKSFKDQFDDVLQTIAVYEAVDDDAYELGVDFGNIVWNGDTPFEDIYKYL